MAWYQVSYKNSIREFDSEESLHAYIMKCVSEDGEAHLLIKMSNHPVLQEFAEQIEADIAAGKRTGWKRKTG